MFQSINQIHPYSGDTPEFATTKQRQSQPSAGFLEAAWFRSLCLVKSVIFYKSRQKLLQDDYTTENTKEY